MNKTLMILVGIGASALAAADDRVNAMLPSDLEGKNVLSITGEKAGDVNAIVFATVGNEKLAIIGLDGIVGDNRKEVAIPLSALSVATDGKSLVSKFSKTQLQAMEDVDASDFREVGKDS